jgi:hypothetical protein
MLHLYGVDRDLQIVANVARTTPLVAIERLSGSASEIWPSREASLPTALSSTRI